jgi:flagellar basal-body rod protein FlgF
VCHIGSKALFLSEFLAPTSFGWTLATASAMDALTVSAASGLRVRMQALDMLANNLANGSTAGFKAEREFYSLFVDSEAQIAAASGFGQRASTLPVVEKPWIDTAQGTLQSTGKTLDLALHGQGFFAVQSPNGTLYTRNGSFQLSTSGEAVTAEGYRLRLENGRPLRVSEGQALEISEDGTVRQGGQVAGKLALVDFQNSDVLQKIGGSYYQVPPGTPASQAAASVHQGKLESSNVIPAQAAVRLIGIMREFEALQKAITINGEMSRKAIEDVARPGA